MDGNIHLDSWMIAERYKGKDVIVFGAGMQGSAFWTCFYGIVNIKCFVDNGKAVGRWLHRTRVYSFEDMICWRSNEIIIISTVQHSVAMSKQLISAGYIPGKDFFVWRNISFTSSRDANVDQFIAHNRNLWNNNRSTKRKILMPYYQNSTISHIVWGYCANYLADRHDAEIYCFECDKLPYHWVHEVYESMGVKGFIYPSLNERQKAQAQNILKCTWTNLKTLRDWRNIEILGENYGKEICEIYIRGIDPSLDMDDYCLQPYLLEIIQKIVFWNDFFAENHVEAILFGMEIYDAGIIRKCALKHGVIGYSVVDSQWSKCEREKTLNYEHYKTFFYELSKIEQYKGIQWGEKYIRKRLQGLVDDIEDAVGLKTVFTQSFTEQKALKQNHQIKVMICPHQFGDAPYQGGWQIFSTPYEWIKYLGELSEQTDYDWYLKAHPLESYRGKKIIEDFLKKYKNIRLLPANVSPYQLREEGMNFALTIYGSIGHEYPFLGIQVINAGNNPHIAFDFNWNPSTLEEYENMLLHLNSLHKKIDVNEIYQFCCIHFRYYYRRDVLKKDMFFKYWKPYLRKITLCDNNWNESKENLDPTNTDTYREFVDEWTPKLHSNIKRLVKQRFEEMDAFQNGKLIYWPKESNNEEL